MMYGWITFKDLDIVQLSEWFPDFLLLARYQDCHRKLRCKPVSGAKRRELIPDTQDIDDG